MLLTMKRLIQKHKHKLIGLSFWLLLLISYQWYTWHAGLSPLEAVQRGIAIVTASAVGPLLFLAFYAIRPFVLFSAALLSVSAGFLFGPIYGVLYVVIGNLISANVSYLTGGYFGRDVFEDTQDGMIQRYAARLRTNSFTTVLTMHLLFLPFDPVNYVCGFLGVYWRSFILATIIGSLPGTITFVLAGAAIETDFNGQMPRLDPLLLLVSATLCVCSLLMSRYLRQKTRQQR